MSVKQIRQQNLQLKEVVNLLSAGEIKQGYQRLNEQGSIKQIPIDSLRLKAVVNDYLGRDNKTQALTLILAGTNQEKDAITKQVRQGLLEQGKLSRESQPINILKSKDLDKFSLTQASSYEIGDVIKFNNNSAKFSKDFYYRVDAVDSKTKTLTLRDSLGNQQSLELNSYKDRTVFQAETCELRLGEQMKFTRNHYQNLTKQINGQQFTVNYCIYAAGTGKSLTVGRESFYVAAS